MSRVVRVQVPAPETVPPVVRVRLALAELLAAARLAGDVPLPVTPTVRSGADRWSRLGEPADAALRREVADAVARAVDAGPAGATAGLAARGLVADGVLHPGAGAGLQVLAGGAASMVLDLVVDRGGPPSRLRAWFGCGPGLAARLATVDGLHYELVWFDPRAWVGEVARAVTVAGWPEPPPGAGRLPDRITLPTELLAGALRAHREHRTDLLPVMAAGHPGVRVGGRDGMRDAAAAEVPALLGSLAGGCLGRLRLCAALRGRDDVGPGLSAWLRFGPGWYELRPGRRATSTLCRRDPAVLGWTTRPLARAAQERAAREVA